MVRQLRQRDGCDVVEARAGAEPRVVMLQQRHEPIGRVLDQTMLRDGGHAPGRVGEGGDLVVRRGLDGRRHGRTARDWIGYRRGGGRDRCRMILGDPGLDLGDIGRGQLEEVAGRAGLRRGQAHDRRDTVHDLPHGATTRSVRVARSAERGRLKCVVARDLGEGFGDAVLQTRSRSRITRDGGLPAGEIGTERHDRHVRDRRRQVDDGKVRLSPGELRPVGEGFGMYRLRGGDPVDHLTLVTRADQCAGEQVAEVVVHGVGRR